MPPKREIRSEPAAAGELQMFKAQFFRALAHPTRIRMLEILVRGGRHQGIVSTQKEGLSVRYALRDPLVGALLDVARRIFDNRLGDSSGLLRELRREGRRG
jgi:hypothetical protein